MASISEPCYSFSFIHLDIYPAELVLKKENETNDTATFLDIQLSIENKTIKTQLFDKRDTYSFNIIRFPYKSSTLPSKMFFSTISAELLRISRATTLLISFIGAAKALILRMKRQGADVFGIKSSLRKMLNRHQDEFSKYSTGFEEILNKMLQFLN